LSSRIGIKSLIVVSSILIIFAGIVLFMKVPSLWVRIYQMEKISSMSGQNGFSYGGGNMGVTDVPLFPAFLILFGLVSMILVYKLKTHLNLFAYINFGVLVTLSFVWLPNYTELMYAQDYGAPLGWLSYYYDHIEITGGNPEVGISGLDFLINAGFWSTVIGAPYLAKKGKSLLAAGFLLGYTGFLLSLVFYVVQIIDSMLWGTIQGFSYVETFLYNINSWTSSVMLFKKVFIFNTSSVNSPLLVGIAAFFYLVGLIGVVLTYLAWHRTGDNVKSYREGIIGGVMMIIGSTLLFGFVGGILAIIGAVESKQEPTIKEVQ